MIEIPAKLYVCFLADTEDNHPNYLPGWEKYGTNYDLKKVNPRFEWIDYFDNLITLFKKNNFLVTWFLRVDECIKELALKKFKPYLSRLDLIGIHIHTLEWDGKIWRQSRNKNIQRRIVKNSIGIFRDSLGFSPIVSRMGWNAMTNEIMAELQENKIFLDCTAVPGYHSKGFFNGRDNIIDWSGAPRIIYHPSKKDYMQKGKMKILEMPISTVNGSHIIYNDFFSSAYGLIPKQASKLLMPYAVLAINKLRLRSHSAFNISPNWDAESLYDIIDSKINSVAKGSDELLAGYFHPSDIFNPKTGKINRDYEKKLQKIFDRLKNSGVEIKPCTALQAARALK